jgi:hypothetical protein
MNEHKLKTQAVEKEFTDPLSDEALDRIEINSDNVCHTGNGGCEIS